MSSTQAGVISTVEASMSDSVEVGLVGKIGNHVSDDGSIGLGDCVFNRGGDGLFRLDWSQ